MMSQFTSLFAQSYFPYGVASGDPLPDRVILWTALANLPNSGIHKLTLEIATDSSFQQITQSKEIETSSEKGYTCKVDAEGLKPGNTYFYRFQYKDQYSPVGRTQTAAIDRDLIKLAVVSCSNFQHGFFTAYKHIIEKDEVDAIVHLGDYIYEYGASKLKRKMSSRIHQPAHEIVQLQDYRQRYAQYRMDSNLREAHRLFPFIVVWDDHETSNNAHSTGAQNHQTSEGTWAKRKAASKQAYLEWMPIRAEQNEPIYRNFSFGGLAELIMIDTRLEARDPQIYSARDSSILDQSRNMLGSTQRSWLMNKLKSSQAKWKLIGNQVLFAPLYGAHIHKRLEDALGDIWDGYPAERCRLTYFLKDENISDVVILTGDFHSSVAFEVPLDDWNFPAGKRNIPYNPKTGEGAVAVEFSTPSISSHNFDDFANYVVKFRPLSRSAAKYIQGRFQKNYKRNKAFPNKKQPINPHLKYMNLVDHGYYQLNINQASIEVHYFLNRHNRKPNKNLKRKKSFQVNAGTHYIEEIPH